jgi:hypothetical protein
LRSYEKSQTSQIPITFHILLRTITDPSWTASLKHKTILIFILSFNFSLLITAIRMRNIVFMVAACSLLQLIEPTSASWWWSWYQNRPSPVVAPTPAPVAPPTPAPVTAAPSSSGYRVVLRTIYDTVSSGQIEEINKEVEQELNEYVTTTREGDGDRHRQLRTAASRDLQGFCQKYCFDARYGCRWCKLNDIFFGADCSNVCRRRGLLEDELDESYSSDVESFTEQQQKDCNALLSSMVSVTQGCSRG